MSTSRDSSFPSASIGRVQGSAIQRSASPSPSLRETLATHPLLSQSPSATSLNANSTSGGSNNAPYQAPPRYVPYTSKHRIASSPTTGTVAHSQLSLSPQQHPGDATSKLQMMNLKAAAQKLGLENDSLGWAILEKLASETDQGPEWNEIWIALMIDRATLLLPLEQSTEDVTAELIKSHLAYCDDSSSKGPIVMLSGLRGTLLDDKLTIRSSVHPSSKSKSFQRIVSITSRPSALSSLPALPSVTSTYPAFTSSSAVSQIPLPPRPIPHTKPPLPPRHGSLIPSRSSMVPQAPRILNPFASLFGSKSSVSIITTNSPSPSATPPISTLPLPDEHPADGIDHPLNVNAYTIDKKLDFQSLAKSISKSLRDDIKASLLLSEHSGMPEWIIYMVVEWVEEAFFPFVTPKGGDEYSVNNVFLLEEDEISQSTQNFYAEVYNAVIEKNHRPRKQRKLTKQNSNTSDQASLISNTDDEISSSEEREERVLGQELEDEKVRLIMERVEGTICDLFYDRLFMPSNSDDLSHDEALSSRIAALNLLDLGLEHLGVEIEATAKDDVQAVIKTCGEILTMMDSPKFRRPADKSALLVKAHKALVDALSKLPPVRLRPDDELEASFQTPRIVQSVEQEMESMSKPIVEHDNPPTSAPPIIASPIQDQTPQISDARPVTPAQPTPVSGDVIFPLLIFSVVKSNPPHLLSNLLYIQRFRNQAVGGEESYCLINLMAVAEFLENVDLHHLGLDGGRDGVVSTADLSPIPVIRPKSRSASRSAGVEGVSPGATIRTQESWTDAAAAMRLRGRVEQQVDAIAGSANKVLSGVVDISFGVLRSFLPGNSTNVVTVQESQNVNTDVVVPEPRAVPGFGLLKRDTGFSIANFTASLPGARQKPVFADTNLDGQQMMEVSSRPLSGAGDTVSLSLQEDESSDVEETDDGGAGGDEEDGADDVGLPLEGAHDARSIRSFESMMSERKAISKKRRRKSAASVGGGPSATAAGRKSIADRLASVPGLGRLSSSYDARDLPPTSGRDSLLPIAPYRIDTPNFSRPASPPVTSVRIAPPNQRFLDCMEDDLKMSEVKELLKEYRRIVDGMRAIGGFAE